MKKPREKKDGSAKNVAIFESVENECENPPNAAMPEIKNSPATTGTNFRKFFLSVLMKNAKPKVQIESNVVIK